MIADRTDADAAPPPPLRTTGHLSRLPAEASASEPSTGGLAPDTPSEGVGSPRLSGLAGLVGRLEVRSLWARIGVAVALSAAAVVVRIVLEPILGESMPFLLYFPAIVVAASIGGHWTGLLTVILCSIGHAFLFEAPSGTGFTADGAEALRLGVFVLVGEGTALVTGATFSARRSALETRATAERLYHAEAQARSDLEAAEQRSRVLYETAAALSDAVTPEEVADVIIRQGVLALGASAGAVLTLADGASGPDRPRLRILRAHGFPPGHVAAAESAPMDRSSATSAAILTGQPVFIRDHGEGGRRFPADADLYVAGSVEGFAAIPLGAESAPVGVLMLTFATPRQFAATEQELILALGEGVQPGAGAGSPLPGRAGRPPRGGAGERGRATRAIGGRGRAATRCAARGCERRAVRVPRLRDDAPARRRAVRAAARGLDRDRSRAPRQTVRSVGMAHADPALLPVLREYRERFPPDQHRGGSIESIRTGKPILRPTLGDDAVPADLDPEMRALILRLGIGSYVSVPLLGSGQVLGAIALSSATPGRYGPADVSIAEDIARRAAATVEHAHLYREARQFIATVDATLDAVFMFEPSTLRFTYVNQGAVSQVGHDRTQLLSMRAIDIKPAFDETRYRELLRTLIDGSRDHLTFNTVHRHRDGFDIPVEVFLQHVRLPGGEARMIITSRDIRAQIDVQASLYRLARGERARAAELNAVIQGMSDGVLVCDADGRVVLANQAASLILGDAIDGYAALAAMIEPGGAPLPPLGTTSPPVEARLLGQPRWIEIGSALVPGDPSDPVDAPATTVLVVRDITAAREAQAAREAFIGVLSHELRTPITTIFGNTKVMRRVSDPATRSDMLGDIETEADRLYRLVEDLLILSRAETGLRIEGEPVLLQHLIPSVLASERLRWPGHQFVDRTPAGLRPVSADRTYLEQVVRNLVTNAAKYGREGGAVILEAAPAGPHSVAVRVLDDGDGVAEGEEERVFELFYRSNSTARRASGAGIGLYVCRVLVEAMGGRIWTRRPPGGGGEFGFTVPMLAADDDLEPARDADG